jgi:hypothetical protein
MMTMNDKATSELWTARVVVLGAIQCQRWTAVWAPHLPLQPGQIDSFIASLAAWTTQLSSGALARKRQSVFSCKLSSVRIFIIPALCNICVSSNSTCFTLVILHVPASHFSQLHFVALCITGGLTRRHELIIGTRAVS